MAPVMPRMRVSQACNCPARGEIEYILSPYSSHTLMSCPLEIEMGVFLQKGMRNSFSIAIVSEIRIYEMLIFKKFCSIALS